VIKDRVVLPHPVRTDLRVAVIVDPESPTAEEVRRAGASVVGSVEDVLGPLLAAFDAKGGGKKGAGGIGKAGKKEEQGTAEDTATSPPQTQQADQQSAKIPFDRLVIHPALLPQLTKTSAPRILGPRQLMPSLKAGTVTPNLAAFVREATSSATYHERMGVIRLAVGQLAFSPEQVRDNIQFIVEKLKKDAVAIVENANVSGMERKEIHEVVLSSTHGPGFSLTGEFMSKSGIGVEELKGDL
jgi:large subunit ribosomal protein L1